MKDKTLTLNLTINWKNRPNKRVLTPLQNWIYTYFKIYPTNTLKQAAKDMGYKSTSSVQRHTIALIKKGFLKMEGRKKIFSLIHFGETQSKNLW